MKKTAELFRFYVCNTQNKTWWLPEDSIVIDNPNNAVYNLKLSDYLNKCIKFL